MCFFPDVRFAVISQKNVPSYYPPTQAITTPASLITYPESSDASLFFVAFVILSTYAFSPVSKL